MFAVGGSVLALGLIVWLLSSGSDESVAPMSDKDRGEDGAGVAASAPPKTTGGSASPSSSGAPTSGAPTSSGSPTQSPSPGAPSSGSRQQPKPPKPKPAPPKPCSDEMLKLVVQVGKPQYRVGQRPHMQMVLTNAGPEPCVKDVSRQVRELVVTGAKDGRRVWSSIDCYPPKTNEKPVLRPGQQLKFDLTWAGRTSSPGCPLDRHQVPAGDYRVTGKIGKLTSAPTPLRLTG